MMQYKGYLSRVEFDDEANIFHGEVINIQDIVTFQGQSVDELYRAFEDSVEDYLAFCAERGEEPNQPPVRNGSRDDPIHSESVGQRSGYHSFAPAKRFCDSDPASAGHHQRQHR